MRADVGDSMSASVDTSEFTSFVKKATLTGSDLLKIEKPGALTVINIQRQLVPVETAATKTSINSQIQASSLTEVVDHIGPSTDYAPSIEFGITSKPNYPIQPFVRPSGMVAGAKAVIKTIEVAFTAIFRRKVG